MQILIAALLLLVQDRAKIAELRKKVTDGQVADKVSAIKELAGIVHEDARDILAAQLAHSNEQVREAAAKAIAKHRRPESVKAVATALNLLIKDQKAARTLVETLAELDMCACLPVLVALLEAEDGYLAEDALRAIAKIGCLEAADPLIAFLKKAEDEERQPDRLPLPGRKTPGPAPGRVARPGGAENSGKDQKLARLAMPVRKLLSMLTGQSYDNYSDWSAWLKRVGTVPKVNSVYLCEATEQTYELASGAVKKCPQPDGKKSHNEIFLKHHKEGQAPIEPPARKKKD